MSDEAGGGCGVGGVSVTWAPWGAAFVGTPPFDPTTLQHCIGTQQLDRTGGTRLGPFL